MPNPKAKPHSTGGISDPQLTKFMNEQVRPIAKKLVEANAICQSARVEYEQIILQLPAYQAADNSDIIDDGRSDHGASQLTKYELDVFMQVVNIGEQNVDGTATGTNPAMGPLGDLARNVTEKAKVGP